MTNLAEKLSSSILSSKSTPASKQPTPFPSTGDWKSKFVGSTALSAKREYTGDKMLGIATMHKSNAVPVFSNDTAKDISRMK